MRRRTGRGLTTVTFENFSKAWNNKGFWRKPRLVMDWEDIQAGKNRMAPMSSQETFFNVCFAVAFGALRATLLGDNLGLAGYAQHFGVLWSLLAFAADYGTRFNDDDLPHKVFWSGYGMGLVGLLMHMKGSAGGFALCAASTMCWIGCMYLRVALYLPKCRSFASFFGCGLIAIGGLWVLLRGYFTDWPVLLWLPALAHQWLTLAFVYLVPRSNDLPMSIDYHTAKLSGITTMSVGQAIVAIGVNPTALDAARQLDVYVGATSCFVLLLAVKFMVFDTDFVATKNHAIRRSRPTALAWLLLCQPVLCFLANLVAAGMSTILQALAAGRDPVLLARGTRMLCRSCAGLLCAVAVTSRQHATGKAHLTCPRLRRARLLRGRTLLASAAAQVAVSRLSWVANWPLLVIAALAADIGLIVLLHMHDQALLAEFVIENTDTPLERTATP